MERRGNTSGNYSDLGLLQKMVVPDWIHWPFVPFMGAKFEKNSVA